jgi:hypothetical protein
VVVSVWVRVVEGTPGDVTSSPVVSFSISTPFRVEVRLVVVDSLTSCVAGTPGVVTVVEVEVDDCAKLAPAINVTAAAANKVFNIVILQIDTAHEIARLAS